MQVILNRYANISSTSAQSEVWRRYTGEVTNAEGWLYGHVQVPGWPLSREPPEVSSYGAPGLPALPNLHLCAPSVPTPTAASKIKKRGKRENVRLTGNLKYNQYFHWLTQIHVECLGKKQKAVIGDESFILALLISPIAYNKGPKWKACAKTHKYVTCSLTHEWMSVTL